jgi:hypothetical protein
MSTFPITESLPRHPVLAYRITTMSIGSSLSRKFYKVGLYKVGHFAAAFKNLAHPSPTPEGCVSCN